MKLLFVLLLVALRFDVIFPSSSEEGIGGYITNGQIAEDGQFPYQVQLIISVPPWGEVICGGTLISDEWILTAAHCLKTVSTIKVLLGTNHLNDGGTEVVTRTYFTHENYTIPKKVSNDIALIQLESPVELSDTIQPANLPTFSSTPPSYEDEVAVISGWGLTETNGWPSLLLQYVSVPIISNSECKETYKKLITESTICTSTVSFMATCSGDSGGPLVLPDTNTVIGVTSFGNKECGAGFPDVFTRVTSYLDWIETISGISTDST